MTDAAPKTTGLQIAIILSAMLATILGVTAYKLYRENLVLKRELEQRTVAPVVSELQFNSNIDRLSALAQTPQSESA